MGKFMDDALVEVTDGILFRFWVHMAAQQPGKVANALLHCLTPEDYRRALLKVAEAERINLPSSERQ